MRYLILLILSVFLITSCSKEKKRCWGCVLVFSDGYVLSYRDSMICDKTQSEINSLKRQLFDARDMGYETYKVDHCSRIR